MAQALKAKNIYAAWADKHYAYDAVRGPSGTGCDDLFTPGQFPSVNTWQRAIEITVVLWGPCKKKCLAVCPKHLLGLAHALMGRVL